MSIRLQDIKKPASLDLTGAGDQFSEYTGIEVVTRVLSDIFRVEYSRSQMPFAYFCDFSEKHPYLDASKRSYQVTNLNSDITLLSGFTPPGFSQTTLSDLPESGSIGVIEAYTPYIHAEHNYVRSGMAFSITLRVMDGATTIYEYPTITSNSYGEFPSITIAGSVLGLVNENENNTYTMICKQVSGPIGRIKAFGLMYRGSVYLAEPYTVLPDPLRNRLSDSAYFNFGSFTWV